jgi:hypothetical protein
MTHDPMHLSHVPEQRQVARCGARTRSGRPCRSPAAIGRRRCRMHGGAPGSGGPKGPRNGARTAPGGSLWRQNTLGKAVPVTRGDRETPLPDAWWRTRVWRTQGAAQRQLQAWPVHRRGDRLSDVDKAANPRREGADQETASALRDLPRGVTAPRRDVAYRGERPMPDRRNKAET